MKLGGAAMFFYLVSEFTPSGEGLNHFFFPTLGTSALITRLKLRVVIHHFWWFLFCIKGQIACDRRALRIVQVFQHLWLALSDSVYVFARGCFSLVLGGKPHTTKSVCIDFEL